MINIELSNHTGDKVEAAKTERERAFQTQLDAYAQALDARSDYSQDLSQAARQAFSDRHYFSWGLTLLRQIRHFFSSRPQAPLGIAVSEEERVWEAGSEGEHRVRAYLSCRLDDRYTLLDGYRNRGGEIDLMLVGPTGVHAIEVKHINGLVSCNGDAWITDKFDRYGNAVEINVPITDRGGRGPSRQVNEAADLLESFLASQSCPCPIRRAVIFCHDHSTLGSIHKPTVDCVSLLKDWDVMAFLNCTSDGSQVIKVSSTQALQLTKLIERDHRFHNRPSKADRPRATTGPHARTGLVPRFKSKSANRPALGRTE